MSLASSLGSNMTQRSPEKNMQLLLDKLDPQVVPEANKYYTFVYQAKTRGIQYDQHPLILCGSVFNWGFTGYNFHWEESRRYTWAEILTNVFEVPDSEIDFLRRYPTVKMRNT